MNIVNLTPHEIVILNEQHEIVKKIPASGKVARLETEKEVAGVSLVPGVLFFRTKYGIPVCMSKNNEQVQFPEREDRTIYIVSGLFRSGYERPDLWQPGELVRDEDGRPVGCIGLSQ